MNTIITPEEARQLGRPIGKVSDNKILAFITEVEQTIIRRKLGDSLYAKLTRGDTLDETYTLLLEGGEYEDKCGNYHILNGLKTAIAYYVYAHNVRTGDYESTRYGMVIKDNEYSTPITPKERDTIANSATEVADSFLKECIEYCIDKGINVGNRRSSHLTSGCVIRKIKV